MTLSRILIYVALIAGLACILVAAPKASRAEMQRYEINQYRIDGSRLDFSIGQFPSYENCMHEIKFVKVRDKGIRLQCDPVKVRR